MDRRPGAAGGAAPTRVADALHTAMLPYTSRSRMTIAFCYTLLTQQENAWLLRSTSAGAIPPLVLGSRIAFDDRGSHELKGVRDPWPVLAARDARG